MVDIEILNAILEEMGYLDVSDDNDDERIVKVDFDPLIFLGLA